jgi:hypothetical protein
LQDSVTEPRRAGRLASALSALRAQLSTASRGEAACLAFGLAGASMALGVTVAQATLAPVLSTPAELRRAVVQAGMAEATLCPDGWAAHHARALGEEEAAITAWYLREALSMQDDAVISAVGLYLQQPGSFAAGDARTEARRQILLCIAEGRRLTQPPEELIPPALRGGTVDA